MISPISNEDRVRMLRGDVLAIRRIGNLVIRIVQRQHPSRKRKLLPKDGLAPQSKKRRLLPKNHLERDYLPQESKKRKFVAVGMVYRETKRNKC